jgi:competence protein ComEA
VPPLNVSVSQRRAIGVLLVCLAALLFFLRHHGGGATAAPLQVAPVRPSTPASPPLIVVDVAGAVARPGLYRLPRGSRVADAVTRAGGLTRRAERSAVNLAAPLADGQQVLVATHGAGAPGGQAAGAGASGPVSLSSATAEQLDSLPGIGPVTAQKIVQYRQEHGPFTSVEGLDAIPGIGPARLANLQGLVVP